MVLVADFQKDVVEHGMVLRSDLFQGKGPVLMFEHKFNFVLFGTVLGMAIVEYQTRFGQKTFVGVPAQVADGKIF